MDNKHELAIRGLQNEFNGMVNISHITHALLSNTLYSLKQEQLERLLITKEVDICISDSMVIEYLNNAAVTDLDWLNENLDDIAFKKGMKFQVYKFKPKENDPSLDVQVLSIDLIDDDDYIDLEDEEEAEAPAAAIAEPLKSMAKGA